MLGRLEDAHLHQQRLPFSGISGFSSACLGACLWSWGLLAWCLDGSAYLAMVFVFLMSTMRSASSITVTSTRSNVIERRWSRSLRRPGVATTMSIPRWISRTLRSNSRSWRTAPRKQKPLGGAPCDRNTSKHKGRNPFLGICPPDYSEGNCQTVLQFPNVRPSCDLTFGNGMPVPV